MAEYSDNELNQLFDTFSCAKDNDLVDFLKEKALLYERICKSRTYLVIDMETFIREGVFELLGYFSLAIQVLKFPDGMSKSLIKKIHGCSYKDKAGNMIEAYPVFLLGQIAKNDAFANRIEGKILFDMALGLLYDASNIVGCRTVLVDCRPIEKLKNVYRQNGFIEVSHCIERNEQYDQMVRVLK